MSLSVYLPLLVYLRLLAHLRARILSLFLCGTLAVYGHHEGMPQLRREALAGLDRTVRPG